MLAELGIAKESLVADRMATYKKHIEIVSPERPAYQARPELWFRHPPLEFEVVTLQVDRKALDQRLFEAAGESGAEFLWERVADIECDGNRVIAARTSRGTRVEARWFIDASGAGTGLLTRKFGIPRIDYGKKKVCLWCHFQTPMRTEGTTFYANIAEDEYLSWIWEIPISPDVTSVGCVMTDDFVRQRRHQGKDTRQILWEALAPYGRFDQLLDEQRDVDVHVVPYQSYLHTNACGPNWLIVGEAASLPDPLTASGFTAALRHAAEGSRLILDSQQGGSLSSHQQSVYNTNLQRIARAFNHGIETSVYENSIRWGLGVMPAQKIYTAFSYVVNALYSKYRPQGWASILCFGLLLRAAWLWTEGWALVGRLCCSLRPGVKSRRLQLAARFGLSSQ